VVAPPFVYLSDLSKVKSQKSKVALAAQNIFWEDSVAYTGEISPKMLKNLGVEYVIIGHSERRKYLNETDGMLNKKVLASLKAGLKVILCVGEPKRELGIKNYELGIKKAKNYIENQLQKDLKGLSMVKGQMSNVIVAYEPVWAINTGHFDTPKDALEMIKFIKNLLATRYSLNSIKVLYGGSVDSKNIADFLKHPEIDGALIGHASLKAGEVKKIIKIVSLNSKGRKNINKKLT
jgi:triosephosphate isomerase